MTGLRWVGRRFGLTGVPGVPARDLSAEEVERYGGEAHLVSLAGGRLYEKPASSEIRRSRTAKAKMERPAAEDKMLRLAAEDKENETWETED